MTNSRVFKRTELYEQVWSKPMIHLAKEYGLSDNGLRKICKKLGVPLPKSGYWSKVSYGKEVEKEPLHEGDYPETYRSPNIPVERNEKKEKEVDPKLQKVIEFENLPENKIRVPVTATHLHPIVKQTKENILSQKRIDKGVLLRGFESLDVNVSPKTLKRALHILNSIILALAKRKIDLTLKHKNKNRNTSVLIWDERIFFRISEKVSQRNLIASEIEEKKKKDKYFYNSREYTPSGNLTLKVYKGDYYCDPCKEFADGKGRPLEERLNEFVIFLHSLSLKLKKERLERDEQHRIWELERQAEEKKLQKAKIENLKIKVLFELVDSWYSAIKLRAFIEEVKKSSAGNELDSWLKWANRQADNIDVTTGNFPANWKWNVDREKAKHWDLRNYEYDEQVAENHKFQQD